jgi:tetratricopeptide (TPR) repeat protein
MGKAKRIKRREKEQAQARRAEHESGTVRFTGTVSLLCAVLIAITLATYWQVTGFELLSLDDETYVSSNEHVKGGPTIQNLGWAFALADQARRSSNYHPLTWVSLMLDTRIYGGTTEEGTRGLEGYHLTNMVFHIVNTLLLFAVVLRLTGYPWRSAFAAALFAVHPLHVESVAWVAERKDVLSTMFWLLTVLAYLWYRRRPGSIRYAVVLLLFAVGLLAKPMLVTLPLVMLMLDFWPLKRFSAISQPASRIEATEPIWKPLVEKIPFLALTVASCFLTYTAQQLGGAVASVNIIALGPRVANALVSYIIYLLKMVWPSGLAPMYPYPVHGWAIYEIAGAVVVLAALTWLAVSLARSRPYFTVGWFWYVVTLVPVIGLVQVGFQGWADRYTYIPLIGIFIILAMGIPELVERWTGRKALAAAGAAVVGVLAVFAHAQAAYWHDSTKLFERSIKITGSNWFMENALGRLQMQEVWRLAQLGKMDESDKLNAVALEHFRKAVAADPTIADCHNNLGYALRALDHMDEAVEEFRKTLSLDPDHIEARLNLANTLAQLGRLDEAIKEYERARRDHPDVVGTYAGLAMLMERTGQYAQAEQLYRRVLREDPRELFARSNLGDLLLNRLGRTDEAIEQYREALRIEPRFAAARYNLAVALQKKGDLEDAVAEYDRLLQEPLSDPVLAYRARLNLAVLLNQRGQTDRAITLLREAAQVNQEKRVDPENGGEYYLKLFSNR